MLQKMGHFNSRRRSKRGSSENDTFFFQTSPMLNHFPLNYKSSILRFGIYSIFNTFYPETARFPGTSRTRNSPISPKLSIFLEIFGSYFIRKLQNVYPFLQAIQNLGNSANLRILPIIGGCPKLNFHFCIRQPLVRFLFPNRVIATRKIQLPLILRTISSLI